MLKGFSNTGVVCVCVFQGLLIESLGRRALIIGGYSLMSLCCVCFTVALTFQVNRSIRNSIC